MKMGSAITVSGIIMFFLGLILFYSIQESPDLDDSTRTIKHIGTFIGLMGIGVTVAGILLYLINRGQQATSEQTSFDV